MAENGDSSTDEFEFDDALPREDDLLQTSHCSLSISKPVRELTSGERELLADLYSFIINHNEEEFLTELKAEKYKTLLNVDITACFSWLCDCWKRYEGFTNITDNDNFDAVEAMIRTGYCPHAGLSRKNTKVMSFQIIHLAAIFGVTRVMKYLLTSCEVNVNCLTGHSEWPPVFHAVHSGSDTTALCLLDNGANPNCLTLRNTLLMEAMSNSSDMVVKRLLCDGRCDVNTTNQIGETALTVAVCQPVTADTCDLVTLLIKAGADVNKKDSLNWTALFYALTHSEFEVVAILLNAGASVNVEDNKGLCPLLLAIHQSEIESTELILEAGADPNCRTEDGYPALTVASYSNDRDMVWLLLKHKADVNAINLEHYSALHFAAWYGFDACVKCLLEAGATHDKRTRDGNTPLSLAAHGGYPDVIDMLLPLGCDVTNADKDLDTPLHYATFNGCLRTVISIIGEGANVNARNACDATPMWNAVHKGHTNVVRCLVRKNADLNVPSRGIDQHRNSVNPVYIYDEPKAPLTTVFDSTWTGDDILIELLLMAGYDIWHEKCLTELTTTPISSDPDVQTVFQTIVSHVFTPPSLFHFCKMSLRNTHKLTLEEFMREQELPKTITNNIILEGIDKCSQKIPLQSFGKIF